MAMARLVSQSLSNTTSISGLSLTLTPRFLTHPRHRSGKAHTVQLIEIDLDSSSSSPSSASSSSSSSAESSDIETVDSGIRKLEEAIHSMLVRRAAPDWLPFRPGASYWVPPSSSSRSHPSGGFLGVMSRLSAPLRAHSDAERSGISGSSSSSSACLSDDELMSHSSDRGWPSSCYFVAEPSHPIPLFEVTMTAETPESAPSDSDEEG